MPVSWAKRRKNPRIKPYLKVKSSGIIDDTFENFLAFFFSFFPPNSLV